MSSRYKSSTWLAGCLVVAICLLIGTAIGSLAGYVVASMTFQPMLASNPSQPPADLTGIIVPTGSDQASAGTHAVIITDPSASATAVSKVLPAVVTVIAQSQLGTGGGSGFFISSDGYVVT